ncbi:MAG: hypothetical protein FWC41_03270 [Firmicutes bacterium]|nr:hypothetical protein [Bacillota bacterium]
MKIGKFVGKETIKITDENVINEITEHLTACGFEREYPFPELLGDNIYFKKKVNPVMFKGIHNYWGTFHKDKHFKAIPRHISITIRLKKGFVEDPLVKDPEWDTQSYSGDVTLYGGFAYKYARNQKAQLNELYNEIFNSHEYDTDINCLLNDIKNTIDNIEQKIAN